MLNNQSNAVASNSTGISNLFFKAKKALKIERPGNVGQFLKCASGSKRLDKSTRTWYHLGSYHSEFNSGHPSCYPKRKQAAIVLRAIKMSRIEDDLAADLLACWTIYHSAF